MEALSDLSSWFWSDDFWLPPNVTWATSEEHKLANNPKVRFAQFEELLTPIVAAFAVIVIRAIVQGIFRRLGIVMGLKVSIQHSK